MKKIVLCAVLVLLIAIGGGVFFLLSNIDDLVKSAIETYGSQAAKTDVRVDAVKIVLTDGSGSIKGLTVANPPGFETTKVFSLGEISTQIDLESLSEDLIVIEHITVRGAKVFFELNQAGKTNLQELKNNISSSPAASSTGSSSSQTAGAEPKLKIRKVLFADGNIHASVVPLDKKYDLKLPKIEMRDLGGSQGATPAQIADQILKVLTDRALAEVQKQGIDQYKKKLEAKVNQKIEAEKKKIEKKISDKVGTQVGEKLKGLINY